MTWGDAQDLVPVGNWICYRSNVLHDDGVTEFVKLTLVEADTDDYTEYFLPCEYAIQLGWHLIGEGARLTVHEEEDDDDD